MHRVVVALPPSQSSFLIYYFFYFQKKIMKVDSLDGAAPSRTRCDRLQPMHKILHKWCRRHTIRTQLVCGFGLKFFIICLKLIHLFYFKVVSAYKIYTGIIPKNINYLHIYLFVIFLKKVLSHDSSSRSVRLQ